MDQRRRGLATAVGISVLIHAAVIGAPGWGLPSLEPLPEPAGLEAYLAARPKPAPKAETLPAPKPAKAAARTPPRPVAAGSGPELPVRPAAAAEDRPAESAAPAVEAPAVPVPAPIAGPPPVALDLPAKGRIRFVVTRGDQGFVIGQSVHEWRQDGATYILRSAAETTGLASLFRPARVVQVSEGTVTAGGLRPGEFRTERGSGSESARFDWEGGRVAFSAGGAREAALPPATQDLLSMIYQMALAAPKEGVVEMAIATTRKLERYAFEVVGEEALALKSGEVRALHLRARSGAETTEIWLAVALPRLPVKIRYTDRKGDQYDQTAEEVDVSAGEGKGKQ